MGTSSAFGGQGGRTPLIPSWLDDGGVAPVVQDGAQPGEGTPSGPPSDRPTNDTLPTNNIQPTLPSSPPIPPTADPTRFSAARNNFSRFASSGGGDRRNLGRAVSHYVRSSLGGARTAARRMGSSRIASSRLFSFLSDVANRGATEALSTLNLSSLASRPIEEVFLGLAGYICPEGGSIDEGIAREAFIETIADLADAGVTDLDGLSVDQIQIVFELYTAHAIEARLCNDIGTKSIILPSDTHGIEQMQSELHDFILRGVSDAFATARTTLAALTPDRVLQFVDDVYEQTFEILQSISDTEAEGT